MQNGSMATITLKNVPEDLVAYLKAEAAKSRRSLNQEAIARLEASSRTATDAERAKRMIAAGQESRRDLEGRIWATDEELDRFINEGRK